MSTNQNLRFLAAVFVGCLACGRTNAPDAAPPTRRPAAPSTKSPSAPPVPVGLTPDAPPTPERKAAPIDIPNARLHDGYVVGGLPSKVQFEAAVEAGFDSAMSLMSNDEEGIADVAPYASSLGVRYIRFTIKDKSELTEAMAWQFASTLALLGKPAIVHSAKGQRVGAIFALKAFFVDEAEVDEAMQIGAAAGMGDLASYVRSRLVR